MIITIKHLKAKTFLGVYEWEKEEKREIIINLSMDVDAPDAARTDDISDTLDYDAVEGDILHYLNETVADLIETLAEGILDILNAFDMVRSATVEIDKPGALKHAQSVSVTSTRTYRR